MARSNHIKKISDTQGGFTGVLADGNPFSSSMTGLGDLDGDGVIDLMVGAQGDVEGAVYVLFMNSDGTVKSHQKIGDETPILSSWLDDDDSFSVSMTLMGDLDGDGVVDVAVGAHGDDDGGSARGAVYILFLNADGTLKAHQKIRTLRRPNLVESTRGICSGQRLPTWETWTATA
ncbi:MAG: integrin alpha [Planctomycetaceae bacterium]